MISEVLVRWFNAMKGVLGMAPDIILNANACTRFNFLALVSVWVALIHILQQYDRIGLMTAVYIHLHVLGLIPQLLRFDIHDNTFFLMTDFIIPIWIITLYHGLLLFVSNFFSCCLFITADTKNCMRPIAIIDN